MYHPVPGVLTEQALHDETEYIDYKYNVTDVTNYDF